MTLSSLSLDLTFPHSSRSLSPANPSSNGRNPSTGEPLLAVVLDLPERIGVGSELRLAPLRLPVQGIGAARPASLGIVIVFFIFDELLRVRVVAVGPRLDSPTAQLASW